MLRKVNEWSKVLNMSCRRSLHPQKERRLMPSLSMQPMQSLGLHLELASLTAHFPESQRSQSSFGYRFYLCDRMSKLKAKCSHAAP